jgi:hypothetical protein
LGSGVGRQGITILEASTSAVCIVAGVEDAASRLGPHVEVFDCNIGARGEGWAVHLDGAPLNAVGGGSLPVVEGDVGVLDSVACYSGHAGPGGIKVQ